MGAQLSGMSLSAVVTDVFVTEVETSELPLVDIYVFHSCICSISVYNTLQECEYTLCAQLWSLCVQLWMLCVQLWMLCSCIQEQ